MDEQRVGVDDAAGLHRHRRLQRADIGGGEGHLVIGEGGEPQRRPHRVGPVQRHTRQRDHVQPGQGDRLTEQGPVRFCPADGSIDVDRAGLTTLEDRFGDYAAATLVAGRYAMAALTAMGSPAVGPAAVCLAGARTRRG